MIKITVLLLVHSYDRPALCVMLPRFLVGFTSSSPGISVTNNKKPWFFAPRTGEYWIYVVYILV